MLGQLGNAFVGAERPDLALVFLQDALAREPVNHEVLMCAQGGGRRRSRSRTPAG